MKYAFLIKGPFRVAEGRAGHVTLLPEQKEVYRAAFPG